MPPANPPEIQSARKNRPKFPDSFLGYSGSICFCLVIAFVSVSVVVVFVVHNSWPPIPTIITAVSVVSSANSTAGTVSNEAKTEPVYTNECPNGKVYVYDLPSEFNKDLLPYNCKDLDRHHWQCGIAADHGFGTPAAELHRILPPSLAISWHRTNRFALEVIFHRRILQHRCRTWEPRSAAAFYIPFYAGLAVGKYLWIDDIPQRDYTCKKVVHWIMKQENYNMYFYGMDHFMAIGRITWDFRRLTDPGKKWGSALLNMPETKKIRRLIIEKAMDDDYDIGTPYPTGFHPATEHNLHEWMNFARDYNRSSLFTFLAAMDGSAEADPFRAFLQKYCTSTADYCRLVDCLAAHCHADTSLVLEAVLESEFCLEPLGDYLGHRTVFECMIAGSVPVFFWKGPVYEEYEGFWPGEVGSYSVYIDRDAARNGSSPIKEILMKYSKEEIRRKRERVIEAIPRIIFGNPKGGLSKFKDGFDFAVDRVLDRIKKGKETLNQFTID